MGTLQPKVVNEFAYGGVEVRTFPQAEEGEDQEDAVEDASCPKNPSPLRFFGNPRTCHRPDRGSQKRHEGEHARGHPALLW